MRVHAQTASEHKETQNRTGMHREADDFESSIEHFILILIVVMAMAIRRVPSKLLGQPQNWNSSGALGLSINLNFN
jgi:hypothetical protein